MLVIVSLPRREAKNAFVQLLVRALFDETGDRLTPSHAKTRTGTRLRYYVSHRLIARSGEAHFGGWRLPASELETTVAHLIKAALMEPDSATRICPSASADEVGVLAGRLESHLAEWTNADQLALVARIDITPGSIGVSLDPDRVSGLLRINIDRIDPAALHIAAPFQIRKRGVESKLILGEKTASVDRALIRNIAKAVHWFAQIKSGKTFAEIAAVEGTSKRRIQQMIDLAFLAPDLVRDVVDGKQPLGFTSDWCKQHSLPPKWDEQRELLTQL